MGAPIKSSRARQQLADTAGATVVGEVTQMLDRPHPGTYLGKGKIEELRGAIDEQHATVIIFDDELSPAQGRNVETALNTRVVDRAELIRVGINSPVRR